MEPCDKRSLNQVNYVHMAHPNTTEYKIPWSYPLSTPVEGVDDTVDFRSTVGGFRRNRGLRGVGTSPKHRWCPNICIRLWWYVAMDISRLRGVTAFTNRTYPPRRLCSSMWKPPFRVRRMEPCDNMRPNQINYVHMAHPNTTKYKSTWSYPLSTPV